MGVYAVNKKILEFIPENQPYGFDHLMLDLLKADNPAAVIPFSGYWLDIGRPDDYAQAVEEFEQKKEMLLGE